jgi:phosphonate transport system substrate-binding protein
MTAHPRLAHALPLLLALIAACTGERGELGSEANPVKIYFVPSVDAAALNENAKIIKAHLEKSTPWKFKTAVPASYIALVEAFGTKRADVAAINTFGYILAHQKFGAEARLRFRRYGQDTFGAQIIARTDGPIQRLEDINGKRFAYVDPASTSGYVLPAKLLKDKGIKPAETVFAHKHDNVVTMVYNRQVDAGATFYTPPAEGRLQDARRLVQTQFPDIEQAVKILALTDEIPIEPIVFRKDMPEEMKQKICEVLLAYIVTEEGKKVFKALYDVSEMRAATDADYDGVRKMLEDLKMDPADLMK